MHADTPVNRIMSAAVLTLSPSDSIDEMLRLLTRHPVHHLPVVEGGCVVGMLSSADVLKVQFFLPSEVQGAELLARGWQVGRIMRSPVITISEHANARHAVELMAAHGIHCLPVVNVDDELTGILTTTDIMRAALDVPMNVSTDDLELTRRFPLAEARVSASLASARKSVGTHRDPYGVSATLLAMQQRMASLEEVANAARRYLRAGQDEHLHAVLTKAVDRADRLDEQMRQPVTVELDD